MIERFAKKLVEFQLKYPKKIIWFFIIMNLLLIPGIFNLIENVEPSLEKVLPSNVKEVNTMNYLRSEFGADMLYLLVHIDEPIQDTRSPEYLRYIDILSEKIKTRENVLEVNSLSTIIKPINNDLIPTSLIESENLFKLSPYTSIYTNSDYSFSVISIRTNTGSSASMISKVITGINEDIDSSEEYNPGTQVEMTGFGAIDRATFWVIMSDFLVITFAAMGSIALIVLMTFKSLKKGMLPMIIVMNALIWTMGMVGYLSLTITVVSMVSAAMIMGLGISFGIHEVHNYFELRKRMSSQAAIRNGMQELVRALLGASLTTMAGFLALLFGVLPAMKNLGIILAIGILNTLIGAIFLLPVIIHLVYKDTKLEVRKQ